jgi:hypothetical protein
MNYSYIIAKENNMKLIVKKAVSYTETNVTGLHQWEWVASIGNRSGRGFSQDQDSAWAAAMEFMRCR